MEGFCGVGKTAIAGRLASKLRGAVHIRGDDLAFKPEKPTPYPGCIRQSKLDQSISDAIASGAVVILDAVCLESIAPSKRWGRGLMVYVKRLSFNTPNNPRWDEGYKLEYGDDVPDREPHRSVHLYHMAALPHENADIIVELPEAGHSLPRKPFNRDHCYDPPGFTSVSSLAP
jgi:hypothetical protein